MSGLSISEGPCVAMSLVLVGCTLAVVSICAYSGLVVQAGPTVEVTTDSGNRARANSTPDGETRCRIVSLDLARGETESILVDLREPSVTTCSGESPPTKGFPKSGGWTLDSPRGIEIMPATIESLHGINADGKSLGRYPDIVHPLDPDQPLSGELRDLFLVVEVASFVNPGNHTAMLHSSDSFGQVTVLILEIEVARYQLPEHSSLGLYMFGLDERSIRYWYNLSYINPLYESLMQSYIDGIQKFRIPIDRFPAIELPVPDELPRAATSQGAKHIEFADDDELVVSAPRFEQIQNDFSFGFVVNISDNSRGKVAAYRWRSRKAGFDITIDSGLMSVVVFAGSESEVVETTLSLPVSPNKKVNVDLSVKASQVVFSVDGARVTEPLKGNQIIPAYGGELSYGGASGGFKLYSQEWRCVRNSANICEGEYASVEDVSEDLVKYLDVRRDQDRLKEWSAMLTTAISGTDDLNRMTRLEQMTSKPEDLILDQLGKAAEEGLRMYVRLPHDEQSSGPRGKRNKQRAQAYKNFFGDRVKVLHSFGNLGGRKTSRSEKNAQLKAFMGQVDIVALRATVLARAHDTLVEMKDAGVEVAPYIHNADKVELGNPGQVGRAFFWKLFAEGYTAVSYWNMSVWFQPGRKLRPARFLVEDEEGFTVSKRNPSSIAAGLMLYPGVDSPLYSKRLHAWRDGIEDYEVLTAIKQAASTTSSRSDRAAYESLLNQVSLRFASSAADWFSSDDEELNAILDLRERAFGLLGR